jgi:hypothetical protein
MKARGKDASAKGAEYESQGKDASAKGAEYESQGQGWPAPKARNMKARGKREAQRNASPLG